MRIAFLVDRFPALSETFILNQIIGLIERGYDVDIFARQKTEDIVTHPEISKYGLLERTRYISPPSNKFIRLIGGAFLAGANFARNPRVILRSLNAFGLGTEVLSLRVLYAAVALLDKYDIIHCQFGPSGSLGALLKRVGIRGKLVTTFHGYDIRLAVERGGAMYQNLFSAGDCFLAISSYNYDKLINLGLDERRLVYHPVGIDLSQFTFREPSRGRDSRVCVRLLTVARLVEAKGLQYGIRAVHRLLRQRPGLNVKYEIFGGGPQKEELEGLVRSLALEGVVCLRGPGNRARIVEALRQSDIFVLPSIAEALPLVLMEAQAVGLPIIATTTGSIHQVVLNGKSGFLVPPGDVDALVDRLDHLITHSEEWAEMGKAGRRHVEENFDIDKLNDRLVLIYQGLLKGPASEMALAKL